MTPPAESRRITRPATANVVLATGIAVSVLLALWTSHLVEREARQKFENAAVDARAAIESRISAYSNILLGVRGLFGTTHPISRDDFRRYIQSFDLQRRYPGAQVIHYSRRIGAAEKEAFEASVRGDTTLNGAFFANFRVRPPGDRPEYVVAQYVEPLAGNERAMGIDFSGDPERRAVLEQARDSGQLTASGPIELGLDPSRRPGFAMRLATYRHDTPLTTAVQRREAFTGMVSASFVVIDLMRGVLSEQFLQKVHVRIHDAGFSNGAGGVLAPVAENLMFDSNRLSKAPAAAGEGESFKMVSDAALDVGGRRWNIQFGARQAFVDASDRWPPIAVLLLGIAISFLLFGLVRSLASVGVRAVALANRMTADLQKSEEVLRVTNERLQMIVQSSPLAIYTRDIDGLVTSWNPAAEKMFGWNAQEVLGKPLASVPVEAREESNALRKRLLAGEEMLKFQGLRQRRDGSTIEVDAFLSPLRDAAGNANGIITVAADITAQKRAVTQLRESERRFADVVDAAGEYVWEIDADTRYVFLSGRVEQVLEYEVDEMLGRKLSEFWPEGESARLRAWFQRNAPGTQRFHNLEHRALTKSGRMVWQRISGVPVFGPSGKPAGYRGTGLDITERRQADLRQAMEHAVTQALSSAETFEEAAPRVLRILCESLGWAYGAHWRLDEEARMLRCVETWHIDAPDIAEFVAASSVTLNEAPAWQSGSTGTGSTETGGLVRRVWARGAPVWFPDVTRVPGFRRGAIAARAGLHCAFAFPVVVGEQPLGVIEAFGRHIEEPDEALLQVLQAIGNQIGQFVARRQAEAAIRAANAELGRQAEDLARSNAELQQFAYVASHDLQEPLRMVSSYTQLIVKRYGAQLDTDAKEFMEFIVDGAARMKRLIEDLLAYSRVGTRGQGFQLTECETALKKALINLRGSIEASSASVTYGRLPILNADGSQLTQLFQNLIGNAIKFKHVEVPHIHVGSEETEDAWVLKVKDNGIGIDPQYFERIFILFQRLHGKAEYPGTGIGLAICKKIMDRHGGRIWVESEPGHGSTFCCSLPKNSKADAVTSAVTSPAGAGTEKRTQA